MAPTLTVYTDAAALLDVAGDFLEAREDENAFLLVFIGRLAAEPPAEPPFLARWHEGDATLGVALLTSLNLIVSRGIGEGAEPLAQALLARGLEVPGVVGPDAIAVARAWSRVHGIPLGPVANQMLYELRTITWPTGVAGRMRPMTEADVELVARWVWGFHQDALPDEPFSEAAARENAAARPAAGMTYLWEVDGVPVAMAALARPTRRGITVNAVYTPPEHRRRGYASALVAAVSDEGLKRGKDFCVLYTDLANPTSNAIYQAIGYKPVSPSTRVSFSAPPAPPPGA